MTLSVCMIVKNEEKNIKRALNSVKNIADEIVVVDTGSKDKTLNILNDFKVKNINSVNVKIINYKWENDFSKARNISLENATSDWILVLDADEEIDKTNGENLKNTINNYKEYEGLYMTLTNFSKGVKTTSAIVFRVFKRNALYRFSGKIHEQIIDSILKIYENNKLIDTDIEIIHYGYDNSVVDTNLKSKRNLELLLSVEEQEKDGYYYYNLGSEYIRAGNTEKCIENYKIAIEKSNYKTSPTIFYPYLIFNLVKLLILNKKPNVAYSYFEDNINNFSDFKDLYYLGAISAFQIGNFSKAKELVEKYYNTNPIHNFYPSNNLEQSFNINEINKAIVEKAFIEENPISSEKCPLTICIEINSSFEIGNTLKSIKNINCHKFIISNEVLDNKEKAEKDLGITIVDDYKTISEKTIINYTKTNYKTPYLLIIKSNEWLTYIGILKLQALLKNPGNFHSAYVQIIEKNIEKHIEKNTETNMGNINYEKRLFKIEPIFYFQEEFYDKNIMATDISIISMDENSENN